MTATTKQNKVDQHPGVQVSGSKRLLDDKRDFQHHKLFGAPAPLSLPPTLSRKPPFGIKNQAFTSFCTAYSTCAASEYQEGVELSPEWQTAKVGQVSGAPILNGADPRKALAAAVIHGSLEQALAQWRLPDVGAEWVANWNNWPAPLDVQAFKHEKLSYFRVDTGPHDAFDNIRLALFLAQPDNGVGIAFTRWYNEWNHPTNGVMLEGKTFSNLYHAHLLIDWKDIDGQTYIVGQNSYGTAFGDAGLTYWSRGEVNRMFSTGDGGAYIFRDLTPDIVYNFYWKNRMWKEIFYRFAGSITGFLAKII